MVGIGRYAVTEKLFCTSTVTHFTVTQSLPENMDPLVTTLHKHVESLEVTLYSYLDYEGMRRRGPRMTISFTLSAHYSLGRVIFVLVATRMASYAKTKIVSKVISDEDVEKIIKILKNRKLFNKKWLELWQDLDPEYIYEPIWHKGCFLYPSISELSEEGKTLTKF